MPTIEIQSVIVSGDHWFLNPQGLDYPGNTTEYRGRLYRSMRWNSWVNHLTVRCFYAGEPNPRVTTHFSAVGIQTRLFRHLAARIWAYVYKRSHGYPRNQKLVFTVPKWLQWDMSYELLKDTLQLFQSPATNFWSDGDEQFTNHREGYCGT